MYVTFIGRQKELGLLRAAHGSDESAFIPIYGRRRIGKSELILQFLGEAPGIYYLGKTAPAELQRREFLREASRACGDPLLAEVSVDSWQRAFELLSERWPKERKLVIALDELQWLVEASPELPSVLQGMWDRKWRRRNVQLIVCGSFVGFMEREILGKKSPLFGRRTAQIHLQPFGYREAAEFHSPWSLADKALVYFICGGVALYHEFFRRERSVEQNIRSAILDEHSALFREPDFLLREELREVESYYAVLNALATGSQTLQTIAASTAIASGSLTYYVNQLVALGYIRRRYPLTGQKPTARSVRYVLADPLLKFWFRFVFPNLSYLQHAGPERCFRDLIRPELTSFFGGCFEDLCREALPTIYEREHVSVPYEIGEYWDRDVQIDVVGLREDGRTDIGECKWGKYGGQRALVRELDSKIERYPNRRGATIGRRYFVRQRPRGVSRAGGWHDLADMYD